ncbi:putative lipid II flippase FtsW [Candidatus Daviesbacteria bacterium]|nr:putative lipid II flippase FtsW [Candidatus Daviesbacteria bacterium]
MRRINPRFSTLSSKKKSFKIDLPILITVILLTIVGLILVYDASVVQAYKDFGDKYFYIKQQLIWAVLGFGSLVFFTFFDYNFFKKISHLIFFASFILLIAVLVPGLGVAAGGAHRWLRLGFITIQPAEIIKISTIIFLSALFEKKVKTLPFVLILGSITFILGILQKDLGSSIVFFLTTLSIYIVAGAKLRYLFTFSPIAILGFIIFILKSTYRKQRILAFLDPFTDPQGFSYHISQILIALGSGSWFGLGLGQSRQKFEYIPEVTTDSIFAIVGEEFGFIGALILILGMSFLIYRGFKIAENAEDNFGKYLSFGLTFWLGIQTLVNLGAMVSLIPLTGVPLPFISYGGSALLANLIAVGILLNISKRPSS